MKTYEDQKMAEERQDIVALNMLLQRLNYERCSSSPLPAHPINRARHARRHMGLRFGDGIGIL